jgi:hypothetical protein
MPGPNVLLKKRYLCFIHVIATVVDKMCVKGMIIWQKCYSNSGFIFEPIRSITALDVPYLDDEMAICTF